MCLLLSSIPSLSLFNVPDFLPRNIDTAHYPKNSVLSFNSYSIGQSSRYVKFIEILEAEHLESQRRKQLITLKHVFRNLGTILYPKTTKNFKRNMYFEIWRRELPIGTIIWCSPTRSLNWDTIAPSLNAFSNVGILPNIGSNYRRKVASVDENHYGRTVVRSWKAVTITQILSFRSHIKHHRL
jgi:hypothetical protein